MPRKRSIRCRRGRARTQRSSTPGSARCCYALQIYFDFSGYSDMAIGLGWHVRHPFADQLRVALQGPQRSPSSGGAGTSRLSRFLRDYLYIPLGGNRRGVLRQRTQPDDHDAARRHLARRRLDVSALGRTPRQRCWSCTASGEQSTFGARHAVGCSNGQSTDVRLCRARVGAVPRRRTSQRRLPFTGDCSA